MKKYSIIVHTEIERDFYLGFFLAHLLGEKRMAVTKTEFPLHLFHHGENFKTYELMGARPAICGKKRGFVFRVWAPRATQVSVIGEFNDWNENSHIMKRMIDGETFELFIPDLKTYDVYKYCIKTRDGRTLYKADPYAFHAETPGATVNNASKLV